MLKKFGCIIIYLLLYLNAEAQRQFVNVKDLLDNIISASNSILNNKKLLDSSCKAHIKEYKDSFSDRNYISLDSAEILQLKGISKRFINSLKQCNNKTTRSLNTSVTNLKTRLDNSVFVKVQVSDNGTGKSLKYKLAIADSPETAIVIDTTITETGKYFEDLFTINRKYSIKVTAEQYNSDSMSFMAKKDTVINIPLTKSISNDNPSNTSENNQNSTSDKDSMQNRILLISVSVLFFAFLFIAIRNAKIYKKLKTATQKNGELENALKKNSVIMEDTKNNLEKKPPEEPGDQTTQPESTITVLVPPVPKNDTYFVCEIMMTAGPRKKPMSDANSDRDLGEDVCGFISNSNEVMIWLLDGTSDDDCWRNPVDKKEYFSSRLLAQSIADKLRKYFIEKPIGLFYTDESLQETIKNAIQEVKTNWLDVIGQLPAEEQRLLKAKIENKTPPLCSTTVLVAQLTIDGRFIGYRTGDSKMVFFNTVSKKGISFVWTSFLEKNEKSEDRVFFRLELNKDGKFGIVSNENKFETVSEENISALISFSDGIGMETEHLLKEEYKNNPDKTKKDIIYCLQGTGDDKSICFIERKERT